MTARKRLFDIALGLLLLLPLGLLMAVVALLLALTEGRPILYGAERMRAPGHPFTLWKFRTMREAGRDSGVSGGDKAARITPVGGILRKGDMSFVGPRPPLRQYVDACPETYAAVLRSRPGVTGLATLVFHRHEERLLAQCATPEETNRVYLRRCIPRKARLDLIYQRRQSLCLDLWILLRTLGGVARRG
jgi:lipopolysaccharide/colanic/teichoic acid biosynthesis glycosyltransferase